MKTPAPRARSIAKTAAEKPAQAGKSVTQKSNQKSPASPAKRSTPIAAMPNLFTQKPGAGKATSKKPGVAMPATKPKKPNTTIAKSAQPDNATALRATKKRAPKDLAVQYGEANKTTRAPVTEAAPRKRRNAASRAKLQAVIVPDDGLMLRLARAGAISSAHVEDNGLADTPFHSPVKRRSRKWETRCGKCGVNAQYSTAAALCIKCGAILVRD